MTARHLPMTARHLTVHQHRPCTRTHRRLEAFAEIESVHAYMPLVSSDYSALLLQGQERKGSPEPCFT